MAKTSDRDSNAMVPVAPLKSADIRDAGPDHIMLVFEYWATEADHKARKTTAMRFILHREDAGKLARNLELSIGQPTFSFDPTKIRPN